MSRPGNHEQAYMQARMLLQHSLPGKATNRVHRAKLAGRIAEVLWRRWKVGIWQWQLKHAQWYLDVHLHTAAASTRYRHWNAIRTVLFAIGRPDLIDWLVKRKNACYLRPTGIPGILGTGRRPKVVKPISGDNIDC